ncbi:MAG: hypothetical protein LC768_09795 [Acidobacteria bacterium]|nr:hypothetical protein [Acidobacteriota bacterium]MCA1638609.1 hypothetical protein [Acidobacteriota bacterium]
MSDKKQCKAENRRGEQCKAFAGESGVCFMHDATKGKERAIARRNGGLATKQPHYADASVLPLTIRNSASVLIVLDYALQESVGLDNSIQRGRLLVSIAHGYIEALKVGEMEQRLEAVEVALKSRKQNK